MKNDFDAFVENLQQRILDETRAEFGDVAFERWRRPICNGMLENPDGYACIKGQCGDTMEMFLIFENGRVKNASHTTDGCGSSTVCGSYAAEMAIGKSPDELLAITGETILNILGKFPKGDEHCAFLAAETLQEALSNYMVSTSR